MPIEVGMPMTMTEALTQLRNQCHQNSVDAGWWEDAVTGQSLDVDHYIPVKLLLIHSEISEAMEGHRKGLMDDKLPHREMIETELADALIRIMDLAGAISSDIGAVVQEKLEYNKTRPDRELSARRKAGGKKY